ncbi:hypothetical protein D3C85_1413800 [compost metagenome]
MAAQWVRVASGTRAHTEEVHVWYTHILWVNRPLSGSLARIGLNLASLKAHSLDRFYRQLLYCLPLGLDHLRWSVELQVKHPVRNVVVLPILLQFSRVTDTGFRNQISMLLLQRRRTFVKGVYKMFRVIADAEQWTAHFRRTRG